jgi:hypothetical protein
LFRAVWSVVNDSHPWWLWPNVLALDAPAVAVTWQLFLASVAGVAVPVAASVVLVLVVWAAYLVDRGLDARGGANRSDRHRAAGRNSTAWLATAAVAGLTALGLALVALPRAQLVVGCAVAGLTAAYFAVVHLVRAKWVLERGAKEVAVGVVFALGVAIPLLAGSEPVSTWLPGVTAFAALCWFNCALISRWEDGPTGGSPLWLAASAGGCAVLAALGSPVPVALAVLASTAALAALAVAQTRVSVRAARVLADVVLLSPLLAAVWP